jgi:hypothetical protein
MRQVYTYICKGGSICTRTTNNIPHRGQEIYSLGDICSTGSLPNTQVVVNAPLTRRNPKRVSKDLLFYSPIADVWPNIEVHARKGLVTVGRPNHLGQMGHDQAKSAQSGGPRQS